MFERITDHLDGVNRSTVNLVRLAVAAGEVTVTHSLVPGTGTNAGTSTGESSRARPSQPATEQQPREEL